MKNEERRQKEEEEARRKRRAEAEAAAIPELSDEEANEEIRQQLAEIEAQKRRER